MKYRIRTVSNLVIIIVNYFWIFIVNVKGASGPLGFDFGNIRNVQKCTRLVRIYVRSKCIHVQYFTEAHYYIQPLLHAYFQTS